MEENITVENISPDVQPECVVAAAVASMPEKKVAVPLTWFTCR
jgi:hypothetical protein